MLVTGAGPIGLLAALLGVQRGLDVHVLDRVTDGPKPELVRRLGATYHTGPVRDIGCAPDIVLECTGADPVIVDVLDAVGPGGIVCLTGVSSGGRTLPVDVGERQPRHGAGEQRGLRLRQRQPAPLAGGGRRARAGRPGLARRLITRRVPLDSSPTRSTRADDVKVVLDLTV